MVVYKVDKSDVLMLLQTYRDLEQKDSDLQNMHIKLKI